MNTKNQVKTKAKTYATSELTNLYDVTVSSISVLIEKQNLKPVKTGQNNAKYYDASVLKQLRLHYAESKPRRGKINNTQDLRIQLAATQSENQLLRGRLESTKSTIEVLRNELKVKNSRIDGLQDLANQARQLSLATHTQHQELLEQKSRPTDEPARHKYGAFN